MSNAEAGKIFRYSPITLATFWIVMCAVVLAFGCALVACIMQFSKVMNAQNFALVAMFLTFLILYVGMGALWLRNRPVLQLTSDGILVDKIGTQKFFLKWQSVTLIEESIARTQSGRMARSYRVSYEGGEFRFDTYYTDFENLLRLLNEQIDRVGIKVLRISGGETLAEKHLEIVPRGRQGFAS